MVQHSLQEFCILALQLNSLFRNSPYSKLTDQMKVLAVDYGRKKIGLAIASSSLAEPYKVIRFRNLGEVYSLLVKEIKVLKVEKVVVGLSEGYMAKETKEFGEVLKKKISIPIVFQDETLSTHDAQRLSIEGNIKRKRRKGLEDAYSATLILQNFLDM